MKLTNARRAELHEERAASLIAGSTEKPDTIFRMAQYLLPDVIWSQES